MPKITIAGMEFDESEIGEFKPYCYKSSKDSLTAYLEDDADYSEVVSPPNSPYTITVFRSQYDKRIVGVRIDGLSRVDKPF